MAHHQDFYSVLAIPKHASLSQIKAAYHRLLLQSHPDKRGSIQDTSHTPDVALIKDAYTTLSNPDLRAAYDARGQTTKSLPRPAQVVSLEEFEQATGEGPWTYPCRCGGSYTISIQLMEEARHLVACSSCSEVIWVGYEQVDEE